MMTQTLRGVIARGYTPKKFSMTAVLSQGAIATREIDGEQVRLDPGRYVITDIREEGPYSPIYMLTIKSRGKFYILPFFDNERTYFKE